MRCTDNYKHFELFRKHLCNGLYHGPITGMPDSIVYFFLDEGIVCVKFAVSAFMVLRKRESSPVFHARIIRETDELISPIRAVFFA